MGWVDGEEKSVYIDKICENRFEHMRLVSVIVKNLLSGRNFIKPYFFNNKTENKHLK